MRASSLTPRQQRFVEEYLVDLNASAAARRAGYSENGVERTASNLLRHPRIAAAISAAQVERSRRTGITADRIVEELGHVAFSDIGQVLDFSSQTGPTMRPSASVPESVRRSISSIKVKMAEDGSQVMEIKLWPKVNALQELARHIITEGLVIGSNNDANKLDFSKLTNEELANLKALLLRCGAAGAERRPQAIPSRLIECRTQGEGTAGV